MTNGIIKEGETLLFHHGNDETTKVHILSILEEAGENVVVAALDEDPSPVQIEEDILLDQCELEWF